MTRPLWTLDEVLRASAGRLELPAGSAGSGQGDASKSVTGISIDTRTLAPGDLFVPLTDVRDGHDFVPTAFERGAVAALVRETYQRKTGDGALIRVDDPLRALERLGSAARARLSPAARVIAITGSAGKTGTKEMLRACLRVCASSPDRVHAPEKSFNNHWGVPLTLARMPADTEFAVFEIGMNHAGEIRPLTKLVRPHIAIVTNVLPVHVGNFPDGEAGVANAKAEIFEGLEAPAASLSPFSALERGEGRGEGQPHGTAIILRDSPHYELLRIAAGRRGAVVRTFGGDSTSDAWFDAIGGWPAETVEPIAMIDGHVRTDRGVIRLDYELGMAGVHLATNSLAVLLALDALGCLAEARLKPLRDLRPPGGRGARALLGSNGAPVLLIDESYNANPASMRAALANLAYVPRDRQPRRIAVLGDMLELGANAVRYHLALADDAARADLVFCCGPNMRHLYDALPPEKRGEWTADSVGLEKVVPDLLRPGDAVMVKGSLGSRMAPVVDAIKNRFAGDGRGG